MNSGVPAAESEVDISNTGDPSVLDGRGWRSQPLANATIRLTTCQRLSHRYISPMDLS